MKLVCLAAMERMNSAGYNSAGVKKILGLADKSIARAKLVFEAKLQKGDRPCSDSQLATLLGLEGDQALMARRAEELVE